MMDAPNKALSEGKFRLVQASIQDDNALLGGFNQSGRSAITRSVLREMKCRSNLSDVLSYFTFVCCDSLHMTVVIAVQPVVTHHPSPVRPFQNFLHFTRLGDRIK